MSTFFFSPPGIIIKDDTIKERVYVISNSFNF
jgi:hypothetical protein